MSEEKKDAGVDYTAATEKVTETKTDLSEAKAELRKFKKANKARTADKIKDKDLKAEFIALETEVEAAQEAWEAAKTAAAELKPSKGKGAGASYTYGKVIDAESKEERDLTKKEEKRWRTHARKAGEKEGVKGAEIPFDPTFFAPKVPKKTKKELKAEEAKAAEAAKGDDTPKETPNEETGKNKRRNRKNK